MGEAGEGLRGPVEAVEADSSTDPQVPASVLGDAINGRVIIHRNEGIFLVVRVGRDRGRIEGNGFEGRKRYPVEAVETVERPKPHEAQMILEDARYVTLGKPLIDAEVFEPEQEVARRRGQRHRLGLLCVEAGGQAAGEQAEGKTFVVKTHGVL